MDIDPQTLAAAIGAATALPVMLLRNRRPRKLNPQYLWVAPLLIVTVVGLSLYFQPQVQPFGPVSWLGLALALVLGSWAGWHRGKTTRIMRDPATGALTFQSSPVGMALVIGLLLLRAAVRPWLSVNAETYGLNGGAVADSFLLFAVGLVAVQRLEMWLRTREPEGLPPPTA